MTSFSILTIMTTPLNTAYLLKALARKGHKVARDKIQQFSLCVWYLGHDISAAGRATSTDSLYFSTFFSSWQKTTTDTFLTSSGIGHGYLISLFASPLYAMIKEASPDTVVWGPPSNNGLSTLTSPPWTFQWLPAFFFEHERKGHALGMLS